MHQQMVYYAADGRDREMELAAAERHMGCSCSPLGRMISRAISRCNGREGRVRKDERFNYAMAYPPAQTCYVCPTARTITVTTSNHRPATTAHAHAIPPEPARTSYADPPGAPFAATAAAPPAGAGGKPRKKKKKRVRFTPAAGGTVPAYDDAPPPHAGHAPRYAEAAAAASDGGTAASVYYQHHSAAEPYAPAPPPAHGQGHVAYGYGSSYGRYAPSPLPRWETLGTPRRQEYFSGEYRWYYPTPVREGIYGMATDANRLTAIFSEENPNACAIV